MEAIRTSYLVIHSLANYSRDQLYEHFRFVLFAMLLAMLPAMLPAMLQCLFAMLPGSEGVVGKSADFGYFESICLNPLPLGYMSMLPFIEKRSSLLAIDL